MKSGQLEKPSKLEPLAKDYIKALIKEAVEALREELKTEIISSMAGRQIQEKGDTNADKLRMDDLESEIGKLWARYKEDDKFTMTRAKIVNWMEKNRIE
tara:strand:- start:288 stop:584 length:297 start_codon:yes stop_codon:yes gene_type:complete